MERHVMTVMCVISRALYTTRLLYCKCRYLLHLIRESPQAAGFTIALRSCSHNPLSLAKTFASQLDCIGRRCDV